jgi:hypothetical protein
VGIAAYAVVRAGLGAWLGWSRPDTSLLALGVVRTTLPLAGKAIWVAFEAMVVPIALLAWVLGRRRQWGLLALWSMGIAVSLASCLAVLDTSRAAAFLIVFLPAACAGLAQYGLDPRVVRLTVARSPLTDKKTGAARRRPRHTIHEQTNRQAHSAEPPPAVSTARMRPR